MILTTLLALAVQVVPDLPAVPERPTYEAARYPLFGRLVRGAGDVDADGTPDLLVADTGGWRPGHRGERAGVFALSGKDGSTLHAVFADRPGEGFGKSLRAAGDVDADGHADWIVGVPDESGATPGAAIVFSGRQGEKLHTWRGEMPGDLFGWAVDGAGDVDGDGHDDLIVGARDADAGRVDSGCVYVYSGATGELLHRIPGGASGMFGYRVRGAGDVDADGRADIAIVRAFAGGGFGHETSILSGADVTPIVRVLSRAQTEAPTLVTRVVDSDGAPAMLVGLKCAAERVSLPDGTVRPLFAAPAEATPASCGILHAVLSDLDGDGVAELLVGVPTSSVADDGRVEVRSGRSGAVLYRVESHTLEDHEYDGISFFGITADAVGDVDGDETIDFVVGCDHSGAVWPGRAWLLSGRDGSVLFAFRRVGGRIVTD